MQLLRSFYLDTSIKFWIIRRKGRFNFYFYQLNLTILDGTIEKILNHISANGEMVKAWQYWIKLTYLDDRALFQAKIKKIFAAPEPTNNNCFSIKTLFKSLAKKVIYLQEIYYRVKKPASLFGFIFM